jgi:hypothetical protein
MICSKAWRRLDGCARRVLEQWGERGIGGRSIPSFSLSVTQKVQKVQEAEKPTGKSNGFPQLLHFLQGSW